MKFRKANIEDSKEIATYLMLAMEDIVYQFIGDNSTQKAIHFLETLIQKKANQYSYENCWIAESELGIIAVANIYDGAKLNELRKPVATHIKSMFNIDFKPEDETQAGEFYIDCVAVHPNQQGTGIGSQFFKFLIDEYISKRNKTLGLLVDKDNRKAKQLYLKLGFKFIEEKTLAGKKLEHLQLKK